MRRKALVISGVIALIVLSVVASAQTTIIELTTNGGFDTSPNGWFYQYTIYSGIGTAVSTWVPSILGRSGVMVLNLYLYNPSGIIGIVNGSIYLIQNVTFPSATLSVTLNISYYFAYTTSSATLGSCYLFAELLYANGTVAWSSLQTITAGSWNNVSFTIPVTSIAPGETYTLVVGAGVSGYVYNLLGAGYINMSLYLDCVHLYAVIKENSSDALGGSAVKAGFAPVLLLWLPVLMPIPIYYVKRAFKRRKGQKE